MEYGGLALNHAEMAEWRSITYCTTYVLVTYNVVVGSRCITRLNIYAKE